ncbi:MAG: AMP-binding protein [Bacteroidota bacterium]
MDALPILHYFYEHEANTPDKPFLKQPFGDRWETYTWREVGQMARKIATGLQSLGLPPKSHIGLVSKNCREWLIADLAIMMAGYVSVPFYPTLTAEQLRQVIDLGDVKATFVGKLEVWDGMKAGIPDGMPIIRFPQYENNSLVTEGEAWEDWLDKYEPMEGRFMPELDDLWTIVFTSGTTGIPKGVMLTYGTTAAVAELSAKSNPLKMDTKGNNTFFSFLPLNHIAERALIELGCLCWGGTISFTESLDRFAKNLQDTRPTFIFAVPRIWTKLQLGVLAKMPQKKLNTYLKIPILSGMVKKKIASGLGMDNTRIRISGAAPLGEPLKEWFASIGIPISEGYGMSENCATTSILPGDVIRPGSVGKPVEGVEVKIEEGTGEICMKAPFNMIGYYKAPEKTAETIVDGWLHTGDQGKLDKDGYLYITGRVKDTFKTSKGKFIVPAPIEFQFGDNQDIEQICVLGLGLPQPIAMVVPSELGMAKSKEELEASLRGSLEQANANLPKYSKISKLIVAPEPFSVENGLLTPTLKVKRNVMNEQYRGKFDEWYERQEAVVWG